MLHLCTADFICCVLLRNFHLLRMNQGFSLTGYCATTARACCLNIYMLLGKRFSTFEHNVNGVSLSQRERVSINILGAHCNISFASQGLNCILVIGHLFATVSLHLALQASGYSHMHTNACKWHGLLRRCEGRAGWETALCNKNKYIHRLKG